MRRYYLGKLLFLTASLTAVVALTYPNVWAAGIISAQVILGAVLVHWNRRESTDSYNTLVKNLATSPAEIRAIIGNGREHG